MAKCENEIKNWSHRWLYKGGKLVLINFFLEAIHVYWMHFRIPLGIIENIRKICFKFLWSVSLEQQDLAWTSWKTLARTKVLGGWGLKILAIVSQVVAAKSA